MAAGEELGEGRVREFGMGMYTVLYLKWIPTKTYSRAQGILLGVMCQPGWEWGLGANGYIRMAEPLCCSPETVNYTPRV